MVKGDPPQATPSVHEQVTAGRRDHELGAEPQLFDQLGHPPRQPRPLGTPVQQVTVNPAAPDHSSHALVRLENDEVSATGAQLTT